MRRTLLLLLPVAVASLLPMGSAFAADAENHCLARAKVTPFEDHSGALIERDGLQRALRYAPPARANDATALVIIRALAGTWDADQNSNTIKDTITVVPGTQVRWQWVEGFHSITDGHDSGDAGAIFNYVLDQAHPVFDTTLATIGELNYFCFVHEGIMHGVINVRGPASVEPGVGAVAAFARPPSPNPSRAGFAFSITLPRETDVTLDVHDASGRAVARIHDGALAAGEHPFAWDGRLSNGRAASNGAYFVRMRAGGVTDSRRIVLRR